jgi:hypothetical protein
MRSPGAVIPVNPRANGSAAGMLPVGSTRNVDRHSSTMFGVDPR